MLKTIIFAVMMLLSFNLLAEDVAPAPVPEDATKSAETAQKLPFTIAQTVVKMALAEDVSIDDAIDAMKSRANALNMKLVTHQPMHKEHKSLGLDNIRHIDIFQFCYADIAKEMIEYDINFAAYMPCRIAVVEDADGKAWLVMMNLDMVMMMADLPESLIGPAKKVRDALMEIMEAGANGDF
ncbi:MAG: DUF302 domain-containing protein [Thiotrichaceae bacterium]|nr:DUF302 domain-containing protein [Thiotrichaceae bacterium]